ncbi:MAG: glycoside hydrolase family protein [Polyangiaceae bacterium]|nr:glycoside hydrolase family protein [Polyangiaceae bacterium]
MKRRSTFFLAVKLVAVASLTVGLAPAVQAAPQQWMDYFQATPIVGSLSSTCWGAAQVGPRDPSNGLEDKAMTSWNYWDGGIIKDEQTGVYHMFASRWSQSNGHNGWMSDSHCVHATSTDLYGPYADEGLCFTDNGGMCHNVNALELKAGDTSGKAFAITCSGSVAGSGRVYGADSLEGPWTYLGDLKLDTNGYDVRFSSGDNFRTILRPDGKYECINGTIGLSDNVLGTYEAQMAGKFTDVVPGHIVDSCRNNMEDPYLFHSGNQYHVFYNCWSAKKAYFYSSPDGIHDWKMEEGYGYDPTSDMVRYTDGTVNHWELLERPSVYLEDGHAVAMTFAAINVPKDQDTPNSGNGSKVIVVPVDGPSFDSGGPPGSVVASGGAGGGPDAGSGGSEGGRGGEGGSSAGSGATTPSGTNTGGNTGTGGATSIAAGGNAGTAGRAEGGTSAGSGGTASSGSSTGGNIGTGGATSIAPGGAAGRGEGGSRAAPAAGGTNGTGGHSGTVDSAGGARSSGGSPAHGDGGSVAETGGTAGTLGGGAGHGGAVPANDKSSGCSCTVGPGRTHSSRGPRPALLLLGLCALACADRRRRRCRRQPARPKCRGARAVKMMILPGRNR